MDFEAQVPLYYTVKAGVSDEELDAALSLLKFTPPDVVIAFTPQDYEQARRLGADTILMGISLDAAYETTQVLVEQDGCSVIWIKGEETLAAFYADGSKLRLV